MEHAATSEPSNPLVRHAVRPLATAMFFVLVTFYWTLLLQHIVTYPVIFLFFGAVMASAWFGGTVAGFLSVVLSAFVVSYCFIPPFFSIHVEPASRNYLLAFIVCASAMSWVSSARKRSERIISEARDLLEDKVLERTAEIERSHREIVESERRLRLLTEAIPQQIWTASPDGRVEYCNQHLLDYLGPSSDSVLTEFASVLHPDDQDSFRDLCASAIASGTRFEGEWRVRSASGQFRWFLIRSIPQLSSTGEINRWYSIHIDTEERRRAERALLLTQSELSHLERTLSMGEVAASIAHELNQPLTAVVTHAYACREWLAAEPANLQRVHSSVEKIVAESTRASAVVSRIRALFQREPQTSERIDINVVVRSLIRILRDQAIERNIVLRTRLAGDLPLIKGDSIQLQQVLLNLASNGMDAISGLDNHADAHREILIATQCCNGSEVLVRVEDGGAGLPSDTASKIFQPFYTTKPQGLGLGLAISRSIIEAHDGRLWATPRPGGGAIFQFTVPGVR